MTNTYSDFISRIGSVIKIRSKNFVNTDCSIEELIRLVYNDIMTKINLSFVKDEYLMDGSESFKIKIDNQDKEDPSSEITEYYGEPSDIVDADDYCITELLQKIDDYTYKWISSELAEQFNTKYISFVRPVHYDMEYLPGRLYHDIFPSMIEGVMYHIEVSIPSQTDGQLSNLTYQRYYQERQNLINRFPQVQYVDKNIPKRNTEWLK